MAVTEQTTQLNGWNVGDVRAAVEMVREQPDAGRLVFRTSTSWDGAFGVDARTQEIEQLGGAMSRPFTMRGDHPPELLGRNTGPSAIETLLAALGSCVAGTYAAQATARGIALDALMVDVEGDIDLQGFFGLAAVRPGLNGVQITIRAEADGAGAEVLRELAAATTGASPVFDSLAHPVRVECVVAAP
jgi:uncharacterized OsmC-like protein